MTRKTASLAFALLPLLLLESSGLPTSSACRKIILENGLVLLYQRDTSSAITSLQILIKGGKQAEPEGMSGLAFLATRLMLEIPDTQSAQKLMIQASPLSLTCQADFSLISIESLSEHFDETLRIMSKPIQWPLFTGIRIEAVKKYMAHQREREMDEAVIQGRALQLQAFFGPAGYGASTYGTEETIKAIKGRDVSRFYETLFQTDNIILAVVSDLEAKDISGLLVKYFKDIRKGKPEGLPFRPPPPPSPKELRLDKETLQSLVSVAFLLPGAGTRSFGPAALAETLLGKGVACRLWGLRQEERLAYNVNCVYTPMKVASVLEAYLECDNSKREVALDALRKVLQNIREKGVSEEELEAAKKIALTDFLQDNEVKSTRALHLAVYEALGLGYDLLEMIPEACRAVTVEEMNAFLSEYLHPDRSVTVIITGTKQK